MAAAADRDNLRFAESDGPPRGLFHFPLVYSEKLQLLFFSLAHPKGKRTDSLGEAYYNNEQFELSLKSYQRALEINEYYVCY